tara:strand:+ start:19881 stop:20744 length:864 start_codon:yes stop_codon:yes gene_type:complete
VGGGVVTQENGLTACRDPSRIGGAQAALLCYFSQFSLIFLFDRGRGGRLDPVDCQRGSLDIARPTSFCGYRCEVGSRGVFAGMMGNKYVLKMMVTASVAVGVFASSGAPSLRGDDPVAPVAPVAIVPNEAVKGGTVMEGTLPPPRKTSLNSATPTAKTALPTATPAGQAGKEDGAARADRPRLGLNVNAERAVINKVYPDSGAAAAGVQPGGQIIAIDGQPVKNTEELKRVIRERTSRDTVTLQVVYGMSANSRGSVTRTPWTKTFRVPLGKPKMIFLELPAPVKEK